MAGGSRVGGPSGTMVSCPSSFIVAEGVAAMGILPGYHSAHAAAKIPVASCSSCVDAKGPVARGVVARGALLAGAEAAGLVAFCPSGNMVGGTTATVAGGDVAGEAEGAMATSSWPEAP